MSANRYDTSTDAQSLAMMFTEVFAVRPDAGDASIRLLAGLLGTFFYATDGAGERGNYQLASAFREDFARISRAASIPRSTSCARAAPRRVEGATDGP